MTTDNLILEKHLKRTTLWANFSSLIVVLIALLTFWYAFYYGTTETLTTHTEEIGEIKKDVKDLKDDVNNNAVFQAAMKEQMKAIQDEMASVKHSQERMEDKLDKLISRQ